MKLNIIGPLLGQILGAESPLEMMKNALYFTLKALHKIFMNEINSKLLFTMFTNNEYLLFN